MTHNAETPRALSGAFQEVLDIGGDAQTGVIVTPTVPPVYVLTSGRTEVAVRCPNRECGAWHRHTGLGEKVGPCGTAYTIAPRRGRAAA